jgi:hypothetical protein
MLGDLLLRAGLLQFGRFAYGGEWQPYQFKLELLPSYPDILEHLTDLSLPLIKDVDHLVCPLSALPFGISLSLRTGIPLVYSDSGSSLVGAYDIGHPALLVANNLHAAPDLKRLIVHARHVGLDIQKALIIADEGRRKLDEVEVEALLDLSEIVTSFIQAGRLPAGQGWLVLDWLNLHHPD